MTTTTRTWLDRFDDSPWAAALFFALLIICFLLFWVGTPTGMDAPQLDQDGVPAVSADATER